jgi:hypothetical protein
MMVTFIIKHSFPRIMLIFYDHYGESFWIILYDNHQTSIFPSFSTIIHPPRPSTSWLPASRCWWPLHSWPCWRDTCGAGARSDRTTGTICGVVWCGETVIFYGRFQRILVGCDMMWPKNTRFLCQWIDWREKLQESPIFHGKIDGFL